MGQAFDSRDPGQVFAETKATRNDQFQGDWDRRGLPAWTYTNPELFEMESDLLFRRHWQLACHQNDIPKNGDYLSFDICGERALIIRGEDGVIRAFHNVCRHRGSRVVAEPRGNCPRAIVCPFHGWSYNLDGTLKRAFMPETLPKLDPVTHGLKPLECENWMGFVFVRFIASDQPSIHKIMARFVDEVAPYDIGEMVPAYPSFWTQKIEVNWKAVRDVDNEGYHVPMAHPGLQDLYGLNYFDEPFRNGANRSFAAFNEGPGRSWSVRHYKKILPEMTGLQESHRKAWLYVGIFPSMVISLYPDSVSLYQEIPLGVGITMQRSATYRYRDESRELRLARYLASRIDSETNREDTRLIEWCYEATQSSGYEGVMLSDLECGVRSHHDHLREALPVMKLENEPRKGSLAEVNAEMTEG